MERIRCVHLLYILFLHLFEERAVPPIWLLHFKAILKRCRNQQIWLKKSLNWNAHFIAAKRH